MALTHAQSIGIAVGVIVGFFLFLILYSWWLLTRKSASRALHQQDGESTRSYRHPNHDVEKTARSRQRQNATTVCTSRHGPHRAISGPWVVGEAGDVILAVLSCAGPGMGAGVDITSPPLPANRSSRYDPPAYAHASSITAHEPSDGATSPSIDAPPPSTPGSPTSTHPNGGHMRISPHSDIDEETQPSRPPPAYTKGTVPHYVEREDERAQEREAAGLSHGVGVRLRIEEAPSQPSQSRALPGRRANSGIRWPREREREPGTGMTFIPWPPAFMML